MKSVTRNRILVRVTKSMSVGIILLRIRAAISLFTAVAKEMVTTLKLKMIVSGAAAGFDSKKAITQLVLDEDLFGILHSTFKLAI